MRKHRGMLAILALLALVTGSAGAGWYYLYSLPHPDDASRGQLLRWLVQREIADEPLELQLALVDRLEEELRGDIGVAQVGSKLNEQQREQLLRNFQQLKKIWFMSGADRYADCPANERASFLESKLQTIHLLSKIRVRDDVPQSDLTSGFFDDVDGWLTQARGEQRRRMRDVVECGVIYWLATDDLRAQPLDVRHDLARRIAAALDQRSQSPMQISLALDYDQREVLRRNALLLFETWFRDCATAYEGVPVDERDEFVSEQISRVYAWQVLDFLMQGSGDSSPEPPSGFLKAMRLSEHISGWIEHSEEPDRMRMRELFAHVQRQLISGNIKLPQRP